MASEIGHATCARCRDTKSVTVGSLSVPCPDCPERELLTMYADKRDAQPLYIATREIWKDVLRELGCPGDVARMEAAEQKRARKAARRKMLHTTTTTTGATP